MRSILGIAIALVLSQWHAGIAASADPSFSTPQRIRIRLPEAAVLDAIEDRAPNIAREVEPSSRWRARSGHTGRSATGGTRSSERDGSSDRPGRTTSEDSQDCDDGREARIAISEESGGPSAVSRAQYTTPQTLSGQVTLGAPQFDPYTLSPHSTLYAPAASLTTPAAGAAAPTVVMPPPNYPAEPYWRHRTGVFGEFLYLRPRNAEVPYAVPIDGPVAPVLGNGIQIGPTATVDPGFQPAFAAGGAFALTETSSLRAKYSRFEQTTTDSTSIAPPDVLRSLVTHPLGMNAATDVLDAAASYQLKFDMIDADYAGALVDQPKYIVNYFGGGRYLRFTQDFDSTFSTIGTTAVNTDIDFNGGGIRLGLEGERHHCPTGCLVFARAASSFVVGEFAAAYTQTDAAGVPVVASSFDAARIVPMLDLEIGAGWMSPNGHVRLTAGYLISAWFNMVTTPEYIQAVQTNDFDGLSDTLTFDGLAARATVQF